MGSRTGTFSRPDFANLLAGQTLTLLAGKQAIALLRAVSLRCVAFAAAPILASTVPRFQQEILMTRTLSMALACLLALPAATFAQSAAVAAATAKAPNVRMAGAEVEVRAKVVELDMARRSVTLRDPKGRLVTVDVPPSVKNFDQVRVGDELVVRYAAAVAARLEPATKSGIRERVESRVATGAAAGALPGAGQVNQIEVLAVIEALDRKARTATLRGVRRTVTMDVPPGVDIDKLKVGDEVRATYVEAAVLGVERATASK